MRGICLSVYVLFIYKMVELKSQRKGVKEYVIHFLGLGQLDLRGVLKDICD